MYTEKHRIAVSQHQFCRGRAEPQLAVMYIDMNRLAFESASGTMSSKIGSSHSIHFEKDQWSMDCVA